VYFARPIRAIKCFSRNAAQRAAFAQKISAQLSIQVVPVDSAQAAVRDADIVITSTNSREPVLCGEWLKPGTHVNAVGANRVEARELDYDVVRRSAFLCVDSIKQAMLEAADLIAPIEGGITSWDNICELSDVAAGKLKGRVSDDDITLFKSLGIALEDVAVGTWVYERAVELRVGNWLAL